MSTSDLALLILRLGIGLTFAAHGAQKAFGWWGGPGPERWAGAVEGMGFRPVSFFTYASIAAELGGGLLLAAGFLTPVAVAILVAQSIVIIFQVHWQHGFFSTQGGIEFPFALLLACVAISLLGPGGASIDALLGFRVSLDLVVALILAGAIAGLVALAIPRTLGARAFGKRPPARVG